jgi:hypothetical protein
MATVAETKLNNMLCNGDNKRLTWEKYIGIHIENHTVLNGMNGYG